MKRFRRGDLQILLATDLISRVIDIAGLKLVINFDVPIEKDVSEFSKSSMETYLKRIGRTDRFDTKELALSLINDDKSQKQELKYLNEIRAEYGVEITELKSVDEVRSVYEAHIA